MSRRSPEGKVSVYTLERKPPRTPTNDVGSIIHASCVFWLSFLLFLSCIRISRYFFFSFVFSTFSSFQDCHVGGPRGGPRRRNYGKKVGKAPVNDSADRKVQELDQTLCVTFWGVVPEFDTKISGKRRGLPSFGKNQGLPCRWLVPTWTLCWVDRTPVLGHTSQYSGHTRARSQRVTSN